MSKRKILCMFDLWVYPLSKLRRVMDSNLNELIKLNREILDMGFGHCKYAEIEAMRDRNIIISRYVALHEEKSRVALLLRVKHGILNP